MSGLPPVIGCGRCLRWVVLLYVGSGIRAFCNASEFHYIPDMCNCILDP